MRLFLDLQLGLAAAVLHVLLGPADDLLGFRFGISTAQVVQQPHQREGQDDGQHRDESHGGCK